MSKEKIIAVTWEDACSIDEWEPSEEIVNGCSEILTVGILLEETDKVLTVALNHDRDGDAYSCRICIPKSLIKKRLLLPLKL